MEDKTIFRQSALEKLSSPEQLDQLVRVTTPIGWVALLSVFVILAIAIVWGFVGRLPERVQGQGILISSSGVKTMDASVSGQIDDVYVEAGDIIQAGQVVARIRVDDQPAGVRITSPSAGQVIEIQASNDSIIDRGDPILSYEAQEEPGVTDLQLILYLGPADGKKVRPGMEVQIAPSTVKPEEYGYLIGRVISVGEFPASQEGMLRVLNNPDLVTLLSAGGAPIEVRVDLVVDGTTMSGFAWTSAKGPPIEMDSGVLSTAWVTIREVSPVSLMLPNINDR